MLDRLVSTFVPSDSSRVRGYFAAGAVLSFASILVAGNDTACPLGFLLFANPESAGSAFRIFGFTGVILLLVSAFARGHFSSIVFVNGVLLLVIAVFTVGRGLHRPFSYFWFNSLIPFLLIIPGALLHESLRLAGGAAPTATR